MSRSKTSRRWLEEHFSDAYVKQSQQQGYRSRASYKLLDLQQKDNLMRPGDCVLDLGAAPGGWSQVAYQQVGPSGRVIASDILSLEPLPGVSFVQGDFSDAQVYEQILQCTQGQPLNLVISDMAPNMTGMKSIDQPRAMHLVELALDIALNTLADNGHFVCKLFQGEGFDAVLAQARAHFRQTVIRKPQASRARSRETYLVAKGFLRKAIG